MGWARVAVTNEHWAPMQGVDVECFDLDRQIPIVVERTDKGGLVVFTGLPDDQRYFFKPRALRVSTAVGGRSFTGQVRLQILSSSGVVCGDAVVEKSGLYGTHTTIQGAIDTVETLTDGGKYIIFVKEGTYAEALTIPTSARRLYFYSCTAHGVRMPSGWGDSFDAPVRVDASALATAALLYENGVVNGPVVFVGFHFKSANAAECVSGGRGYMRFLECKIENTNAAGEGFVGGGIVGGSGTDELDLDRCVIQVPAGQQAIDLAATVCHIHGCRIQGWVDIVTASECRISHSWFVASGSPVVTLGNRLVGSGKYRFVDNHLYASATGTDGLKLEARSENGAEMFIIVGNNFLGKATSTARAIRTDFNIYPNAVPCVIVGNSFSQWLIGIQIGTDDNVAVGTNAYEDVPTHIDGDPAPPDAEIYGHTLLDGYLHTDTLLGAVLDGDTIIGNVTPKWSRLAISIPAANVRNVLGIDNGELRASWKTALDATLPATLVAGGAGAAGTSLVFSHRDHNHPAPATWPPGVHTHAHGDLTGVTADQHHAGFVGLIINGPSTISPDANDLITIEDTASVTWASSGAGKIAATAVAGGGGNMATDPLWDAAGDLAVGTGADTGARLVLTVPAATFFNVLGVLNAETTPTWKALFDATVPTTIAPSDAAATGSAVAAARRDHLHGAPATFPAMAHDLDGASHTGVADYTSVLGLTSLTIGDANFGLIISVGNPALTWDTGDFIQYVRASNYWSFAIGGANMGHIGLDQFRLTLDGTVSSPDNAFALYIGQIQLDPANGWAAFGLYGGGTVVATAGETVSAAYGIYSEAMAKSGSGTITTAYGLYVVAPTIGTTNIGALIGGQLVLPVTGSTGGLLIGGDVNLYRSAANVLKTDGTLHVAVNALVAGYARIGSLTAPTNTTAGDLTAERLSLGNAAFINGALLYAYRTDTAVAGDPQTVYIYQKNDPSGASDVDRRALMVRNEYSGAQNETGIVFGVGSGFYLTGTGDVEDGGGVYAIALAPRTGAGAAMGTIGKAASIHALMFDAFGRAAAETVVVTDLRGLNVQLIEVGSTFIAGDAVTNAAGVYIGNIGDSHITNAVGLDIAAQSGATTLNFGIRNAGNSVQTGYARLGAVTAPNNVTAGDLTLVRLSIGNAALGTGSVAYVYSADTNNASVNKSLLLTTFTPTVGGAYNQYGLNVDTRYLGAVANTGVISAGYFTFQLQGTGKPSYAIALYGVGLNARTGTGAAMSVGAARALSFQMFSGGARVAAETVAIDALTGIHIDSGYASFITGDTVTDAYGIFLQNIGNAKVTNAYGIYMALVTGSATLNIGMKLDGGATCALWLNTNSVISGSIRWGTARDTTLYRAGANVLGSGGSLWLEGYAQIGTSAAPFNTTAGDLTCARLFVGDAAAVAGKEALITGDMAITGTLVIGTAPDYTVTNGTTDRTFDANATTLDEIADVLGSLIADLQVMGLLA